MIDREPEDQRGEEGGLRVVPAAPRGLVDELVDAGDGDHVAALRVEVDEARRHEANAHGALTAARAKHEEFKRSPKTANYRTVEAAEDAAAAHRAYEVAAAQREAATARLLRAEDAGTGASPSGRLLRFSCTEEFVVEFAVPLWEHRKPPDSKEAALRWCPQWWQHAAAVGAFDALWEGFEVARLEPPPSIAAWYRDFLWPFMTELTRPEGPFQRCGPDRGHRDTEPWPVDPAPAGLFATYPSESQQLQSVNEHQEGA